ncbi:rhombosortase [Shewanella nanhaiensis]|uniref:Rhombosortase n=1 Tax=Shewanella nanhaiensis TaxID=2864872 RepID=A0ABS7E598_9GAMM|nr:rhombosortase [Shewanella nanhaiensis]
MLKLTSLFGKSFPVLVLLTLCAIGFYYAGLDNELAYRRSEITAGEYWRLFSGNLLHTNGWHLAMNLAGLWVIILLHQQYYRSLGFALIFILLCWLQGIGLYLFYPGLVGYVGLSGMLHGLFVYGALKDISVGMRSGYLLLVGVIVKVAYEQWFGASEQVTEMIGARVATEAHLVGVVTGILLFACVMSYRALCANKEIKKAE